MAEAVKQVEATINGAIEAIAELDWYVPLVYERISADDSLLALSNASRQYHLVKPIMTDRPVLEISEGRHLIQEQLVHTYVTNDTLLQGGHQEDESGLNSMVSTPRLERFRELIEDDCDWCEWIWEICIWEASCSHCVYGSNREFRSCHQRYYWDRR
jgi:hypothetical protein